MPLLTDRFKALPIDTIQRLEKTIDLVFEKVIYIYKQSKTIYTSILLCVK